MYVDLTAVLASFKDKKGVKLDVTIEDSQGEAIIMFSHDLAPRSADELVDELSAKFEDLTSMLYLQIEEGEEQ